MLIHYVMTGDKVLATFQIPGHLYKELVVKRKPFLLVVIGGVVHFRAQENVRSAEIQDRFGSGTLQHVHAYGVNSF